MLRPSHLCRASLLERLESLRSTPAFIRHSPPTLYVTCDFASARRHATLLLDASAPTDPPLTRCAFLLSTTTADDPSFAEAESALVGVPVSRDPSDAARLVDALLAAVSARRDVTPPLRGIRRVLVPEWDASALAAVDALRARLPTLSPDAVGAVRGGDEVRVAAGRSLRAGRAEAPFGRVLFDAAFGALLVGPSVCARPGWLPALAPTARRPWPMPPPAGVWRPTDDARRLQSALAEFPDAQRVLSLAGGEAGGDAETFATEAMECAERLDALRRRLGRRIDAGGSRRAEDWVEALEEKLMAEVLLPDATPEIRAMCKEGLREVYLRRTAHAIAVAALELPPEQEATHQTSHTARTEQKTKHASRGNETTLQEHLERHGMGQLGAIATKEEIDVTVFLAMASDDFKKVFKATFGLVKKLEFLQQELRNK